MIYEQCLVERNATLVSIFGHDVDVNNVPEPGALINVPSGNGSLDNILMPELPICDLEKELDNVS